VVLETLAKLMGIKVSKTALDDMIIQMDAVVTNVYHQFPPDIRERLDQRKLAPQTNQESISEEDEQWFKEHIDEFFNKDKGV
jgi:hypothetical protein